MKRYLGACLAFAGLCLMASAGIGTADWAICVSNGGGDTCRSARGEAMTALIGAANTFLGVALQEGQFPSP